MTFALLRARPAIIHLVNEARGPDVNLGTIDKLSRAGDAGSVTVGGTIRRDHVIHVTTSHHSFTWVCACKGVDDVETFREEVRREGPVQRGRSREGGADAGVLREPEGGDEGRSVQEQEGAGG